MTMHVVSVKDPWDCPELILLSPDVLHQPPAIMIQTAKATIPLRVEVKPEISPVIGGTQSLALVRIRHDGPWLWATTLTQLSCLIKP